MTKAAADPSRRRLVVAAGYDWQMTGMDAAAIRRMLGPVTPPPPANLSIESESVEDGYRLRKISYDVPSGRAFAFVCLPDRPDPARLVFCHHQHAGNFELGKSEVVGRLGDPDQAYAAELARRGYVTISPDAIGFEERNWADGVNTTWFELATRLVAGRTLLADCLQEISIAIDIGTALPEVDADKVGFIGHSYGGRAAIWAPLWDERIIASVSNCGCIPYRESLGRDTGPQAEFVIPGILGVADVEDVLAATHKCATLVIARADDRWSRGVGALREALAARGASHVTLEIEPGGHVFPEETRNAAYRHLDEYLT